MRAAKNKDIIRYGDIYQSANRTPTSSGQDSILNFNVIDSCELGDVDSWLLVLQQCRVESRVDGTTCHRRELNQSFIFVNICILTQEVPTLLPSSKIFDLERCRLLLGPLSFASSNCLFSYFVYLVVFRTQNLEFRNSLVYYLTTSTQIHLLSCASERLCLQSRVLSFQSLHLVFRSYVSNIHRSQVARLCTFRDCSSMKMIYVTSVKSV